MNLTKKITLGAVSLMAGLSAMAQPLDLGNRWELFVDRFLIDEMKGTSLELHHPHREGIAIPFDDEWDRDASGYATVINDNGLHRMYYRGGPAFARPGQREGDSSYVCYAESTDGITWVKPKLGLVEFNGSKDNNIIMLPSPKDDPYNQSFSPFLDTREGVPADERYKAVGGQFPKGMYVMVSPDGIHWKKYHEDPVFKNGAFDSQNVAFWSETEQLYLLYFRVFTGIPDYTDTDQKWSIQGYRSISRTTSKDLINWSEPERMSFGNTPLEHLYTNHTRPYFRAPHIYISMPVRFVPGRHFLSKQELLDQGVAQAFLDIKGPTHDIPNEVTDTVFLTSRGGSRYDRTFMESYIRPGLDLGNWVSRNGFPATGLVQTGPAEMSIYVGQNYVQPTAHLARYSMRLDGFGSLSAGYEEGEMLTKPIIVTGKHLVLNNSTSANGHIYVEVQTADGEPIPGYSLKECKLIVGDSIERTVEWDTTSDLSALEGQAVRLRFVMSDADVFALRFE